jgi:predicted secreted hydrolase
MKNSWIAGIFLMILPASAATQYKTALPGYRYEFPRDHFNHPEFQTEWWYYTGNLQTEDGHHFGFELTFFRQAVSRDATLNAVWDVQDVYLAHLALSDPDGNEFYHTERTNRSGPGIAGISETQQRIWNGNWQVTWKGDDQELRAGEEHFTLAVLLHPAKPPVIHGENGVSQKASGPGHASHYISYTRLATRGKIEVRGKSYRVTGTAWMDHEFFTQQLESEQIGWDWFSVQLNDNTELMLFQIRRRDGSIDPFSAGTYVEASGKPMHLRAAEFSLHPVGSTWTSPATLAKYPVQWAIAIPKLGIQLEAKTALKSQELAVSSKITPSYWEGAMSFSGRGANSELTGVGYLEMTGYDRAVVFGP